MLVPEPILQQLGVSILLEGLQGSSPGAAHTPGIPPELRTGWKRRTCRPGVQLLGSRG